MGKTTCSAAAAIGLAEGGRRVLVVSTDPAHSLGDALGRRLGPRPRRVAVRRGRLDAVELDADAALVRWLDERRERLATIALRGTYLDRDDVERFLSLSLPGTDELIGLLELSRLARGRAYDEVVVDTAPTGHTLRLLQMPATLREIATVLDDMQGKHRFLARSLGGRYRPDASVRAARTVPVSSLRAWTTAPGTGSPLFMRTIPASVADVVCAVTALGRARRRRTAPSRHARSVEAP